LLEQASSRRAHLKNLTTALRDWSDLVRDPAAAEEAAAIEAEVARLGG
jgi:hypothetical protein